jgi:hypothetical protein
VKLLYSESLTKSTKNSIIQKTHKHTRTLAAVAPAEAGSIGSTVPVVWKKETVVLVRDRVRVERTALEIAGILRGFTQTCLPTKLPKVIFPWG